MAVPYYGDFAENDTVNIPFNTFDSNDPSESVTITELADADIKVHKDAHVDQIVTDGATIVINFDGITGNHYVTIDTNADAAYVAGSEYAVRIEGTTVDGGTINAWIGAFSIERAGGVLALIKAGTIDVNTKTATLTALDSILKTSTFALAIADAIWDEVLTGATHNVSTSAGKRLRSIENVTSSTVNDAGASATVFVTNLIEGTTGHYNHQLVYFSDGNLEGQLQIISGYAGGSKTITVEGGFTEAPGDGDSFDIIPVHVHPRAEVADAVWDDPIADHTAADSFGKTVGDTLADTNAIQGKLPANKFMGSSDGADDDGTLNTIATNAARLTAARAGALTDWINGGRLDLLLDAILTDTGTTLQAELDGIQADTEDIQSRLPAALSSGNIKADALAISTSTDAADKLEASAETMLIGTVSHDNTIATTTVFYCDDITEATADHFNGRIVIFTSGDLIRQATDITDYELSVGEGKFTVTALTEAPADNVTFIIL